MADTDNDYNKEHDEWLTFEGGAVRRFVACCDSGQPVGDTDTSQGRGVSVSAHGTISESL